MLHFIKYYKIKIINKIEIILILNKIKHNKIKIKHDTNNQ